MSYPKLETDDNLLDLLSRKEFYSLKAGDSNFREAKIQDTHAGKYLKIHSHQLFVRNFMNPNTGYDRLHLSHGTGCHGAGTKVITYGGAAVCVEDIAVGDLLMGDDSTPRLVRGLARGVEDMYKVCPNGGIPFVCNASHILSLMGPRGDIINITIKKYLRGLALDPVVYSKYLLYRRQINVPGEQLNLLDAHGGTLGDARDISLGDLQTWQILHSTTEARLAVLERLGYNHGSDTKQIIYVNVPPTSETPAGPKAISNVLGICWSLGLCAVADGNSIEISPGRIPFTLEAIGRDKYYGFYLDGNHLYILEDYIVTHNTGKCHPAGTPIRMYSGRTQEVQDITVGSLLMGDDSRPRTVTSICSGTDDMYVIELEDGSSFGCNRGHMLCMIRPDGSSQVGSRDYRDSHNRNNPRGSHNPSDPRDPHDFPGAVVEMPLDEYLGLSAQEQEGFLMYRLPVRYPRAPVGTNQLHKLIGPGPVRAVDILAAKSLLTADLETRFKYLAELHGVHNPLYIECAPEAADLLLELAWSVGASATRWEHDTSATRWEHDTSATRWEHDTSATRWARGIIVELHSHHGFGELRAKAQLTPPRGLRFKVRSVGLRAYYGFTITGNGRYMLGNYIVTHNTLAAVSIAMEFVHVYQKLYTAMAAQIGSRRHQYAELDAATPTVFILGFDPTKKAFARELLKYPEFGYITIDEKFELAQRERAAASGLAEDIAAYKEFKNSLKGRIKSKRRGGFFVFYGYDEFVGKLFSLDGVNLIDIEQESLRDLQAGGNRTLDVVLRDYIKAGKIRVNRTMISRFNNSLIIADEVHHTYNMNMKNNRGVAIQYVLDTTNARFLSMSATPVNNSPTEIVELLNYLNREKISKRDLFTGSGALLPGALEKIARLSFGKFSFLQDANLQYYPKRIMEGDPLVLPGPIVGAPAWREIPYLKFVQCPMSELHQATYFNYIRNATSEPPGEDEEEADTPAGIEVQERPYHRIPTDGYSLLDMVFPAPGDTANSLGLFRSAEVRSTIAAAGQEWKDQTGIGLAKYSSTNVLITGRFLQRASIAKYSSKYANLLDILDSILGSFGDPSASKKIMIYHHRVKMSGVLLVQELLRENGYIDEHTEPTDGTKCVCGAPMSDPRHITGAATTDATTQRHKFVAARFTTAHSDIDQQTMDESLSVYNAPDNSRGHNCLILIGSSKVKEGYDFKAVQYLIVLSIPFNIPTLIQVFGRCIRKNSHIDLPASERVVHIYILITTVNKSLPYDDPVAPEVYRYIDKLTEYMAIQKVEREINRAAIDADIHRDITMPKELRDEYFPPGAAEPVDNLGNLYFEPAVTVGITPAQLNLSTFNAYNHNQEEIRTISYIIKRLFMLRPAYTYADLLAAVRNPPIGVETNPALFSEGNFAVALSGLLGPDTTGAGPGGNAYTIPPVLSKEGSHIAEYKILDYLLDPNDQYIYNNGRRYKIKQVGEYYIAFEVTFDAESQYNYVQSIMPDYARDREKAIIQYLKEPTEKLIDDVDAFMRTARNGDDVLVDVAAYVADSRRGISYEVHRERLYDTYKVADDDELLNILVDFSAQFQQTFIEECIVAINQGNADEVMNRVISMYSRFGMIIYGTEVVKYRDIARKYRGAIPKGAIGYETKKSIKLYDVGAVTSDQAQEQVPEQAQEQVQERVQEQVQERVQEPAPRQSDEYGPGVSSPDVKPVWFETSKISMNRHSNFTENEVIIGYIETDSDHMQFKLRNPIHVVRESAKRGFANRQTEQRQTYTTSSRIRTMDIRLYERGITCVTKHKTDLMNILSRLGFSLSKLDKREIRRRNLCDIIRHQLILREIRERQKDSKWKYFYGWWSKLPSLK